MAEQFYDVTNLKHKKLHQQYIKKAFDNFKGNTNVIQFTSEEYTGPLHFMAFWLDEAQKWKAENGNKTLVGLSATKDVQDAILNDDKRTKIVDVIEIKYWHYKSDGSLYAPEGGKNMAPRQHARKMKVGKETEQQVYRAVREYHDKFSDKIILYSTNRAPSFGWSVAMAGGSLPNIPKVEAPGFLKALAEGEPTKNTTYQDDVWQLEQPGDSYIMYFVNSNSAELDLSNVRGKFQLYWINAKDGKVISKSTIKGKAKIKLQTPSEVNKAVVYIKKQ